jgi:hypothetical protein
METTKDELQHIILGDEQAGGRSQLKKTQAFLRRHAEANGDSKEQKHFKSEETAELITFAQQEGLFYEQLIDEQNYLNSGAEQRVYRLDVDYVIKTNSGIFYECWLDYFNSLLIHNYYFPATAYTFLGFKIIDSELHAVVQQEFVVTTEETDINVVKKFLLYNGFVNTRNNDYVNPDLGIIFEDLHDENVLTKAPILFFVDTIFYLTPEFYLKA